MITLTMAHFVAALAIAYVCGLATVTVGFVLLASFFRKAEDDERREILRDLNYR